MVLAGLAGLVGLVGLAGLVGIAWLFASAGVAGCLATAVTSRKQVHTNK